MCKLNQNDISNTIDEELSTKLCAGCDEPNKYLTIWNQNHKPYCPRCYEEIVSLYKIKDKVNVQDG